MDRNDGHHLPPYKGSSLGSLLGSYLDYFFGSLLDFSLDSLLGTYLDYFFGSLLDFSLDSLVGSLCSGKNRERF
jgi:hypothetical protein